MILLHSSGGEAPARHPLLLSVRQGQVGGGAQAPGLGGEGAQRVGAELPRAQLQRPLHQRRVGY